MRYLFGFLCVCALGMVSVAGCSDTAGDGGSGGSAGSGGGSGVECVDNVCPCTEAGIRAAVTEGGGPYAFDCDGPQEVITEAEIVIDNDVIMDGEGNLTVAADFGHRVFSVAEGVTATLDGLAVGRGFVIGEDGGGIFNSGTLTLANSRVWANIADDIPFVGGNGGGIFNSGTLTLTNSTVAGNTGESSGGGIGSTGTVTLTNSTVAGNTARQSGGGIDNRGTLTVTNSTVSGNTSEENGGGGISSWGGTLALTNSTVSGNTAGESGPRDVSGGGGILSGGTLTVTNSTVSGNTSEENGGGIFVMPETVTTITNSTVSGNTAAELGGGMMIFSPSSSPGTLTLTQSTVAQNSASEGGGIWSVSNEGLTVTTSLIDGDCNERPVSSSHSIESPGRTCGFVQLPVSADDLKLGPLQDNGGPTETQALLPGSVAIDQIPAADCLDADGEPLTTDQRGVERPQGDTCDVGSVEMEVTP